MYFLSILSITNNLYFLAKYIYHIHVYVAFDSVMGCQGVGKVGPVNQNSKK